MGSDRLRHSDTPTVSIRRGEMRVLRTMCAGHGFPTQIRVMRWSNTARAVLLGLVSTLAMGQKPDEGDLLRQAKAAMRARQFQAAERIYSRLLANRPSEPGLILNLGLAQFSQGNNVEAVGSFRRFVRLQPDHAPAWLLLGVAQQRLDRPAEAVPALERALELDPSNGTARMELADALLRSGRPREALGAFQALVQTDAKNPQVLLGLGLSYTELSRKDAATLARTNPQSPYHSLLLGHAAQAQRRDRAAYAHYRAALAKNPRAPGAHERIAEIYRGAGRDDWATTELAKRPSLRPCEARQLECLFEARDFDSVLRVAGGQDTPEAFYWRARAYAEKARLTHEDLLALPPSASAYWLLASIEDLAGRPRIASDAWHQAIKLEPSNPALRRNLLRSLSAAGLREDALREAEVLLELRPDDPEGLYYAGDALLQSGRVDEAIPRLESAVEGDSTSVKSRASLATAYLRSGQGARAIPHLEHAVGIQPDAGLLFQLARAYQAVGRSAEARAALQRRQAILSTQRADVADDITPP